jgi:hypothetical protein
MSLKIKIAARLKAKAAGVNLSQTRIDAIVARAEKGGLTDESDDTAIDAQLDIINELTPFKEIASLDDHQRAKAKKEADDKEAKRLADIAAGKQPEKEELPADTPAWAVAFMKAQKEETEALKAKLAAFDGEKVASTRKERYAKVLEGKPAEFIAAELKKFDRMTFKDDAEFDAVLTDFTQEVSNTDLGGDRPAGGFGLPPNGKKEATPAEVEAAVDSIL